MRLINLLVLLASLVATVKSNETSTVTPAGSIITTTTLTTTDDKLNWTPSIGTAATTEDDDGEDDLTAGDEHVGGGNANVSMPMTTTSTTPTTELPVNHGEVTASGEIEKEEATDETPDEESEETEEVDDDNNHNHVHDNEEGGEEEEEEEEHCTFNRFLSGLNISHYLPEDRDTLKTEYEGFEAESPHRIRSSPSVNFTIQRLKRLLNLANTITSRQEFRSGLTTFVQHNYDLFLELELDASCVTSLISIIAAIRRSELWAIKFVDSMAKPPPGLLSGVTSFLGDFDQCLSVSSPDTASEEFKGQYCLLRPILPLPEIKRYSGAADEGLIRETKLLNYLAAYQLDGYVETNPVLKFIEHMKTIDGRVLNFGLCIPNLCSPGQLEKSFNKLLYPIIGIPFEINNASCWTRDRAQSYTHDLSQYGQFAIIILSTLVALVVVSTVYEFYFRTILPRQMSMSSNPAKTTDAARPVPPPPNNLLLIFSAISNTARLVAPSPHRLAPFDTLRLVIIVLIGLTNTFFFTTLTPGLKRMSQSAPYEMLSERKYFFVRAPTLLNDGLLVVGGALFVRSIFQHLNSPHDVFSYILYLLRRWLRLTAPLFGSIMFIYLLPVFGSGPLWDRLTEIMQPACQQPSSLSASLLYYSNWNFIKANYSGLEDTLVCNPETWFLSVIFQLNVVFFAIVIFIYQSPRSALRVVFLLVLASLVLNISPRLLHSNTRTFYELTRQQSFWALRRNFYLYHQNIIQYVGAFAVGLMLGYVIVVDENRRLLPEVAAANKHRNAEHTHSMVVAKEKRHRRVVMFTWCAVATIVLCYVWVNQFFVQNASPSEISVLMFFSFGRLAFSLAFAWICYVSISGKIEFLSSTLSSPSIQPVARLSFSIFLVQGLVQYHRMFSIKDTYVMTFRSTIEHYIIDLLISIVFGYLLHLLFEAPSQRLNEIFCGKAGGDEQESMDYGHRPSDYIYGPSQHAVVINSKSGPNRVDTHDYHNYHLASKSPGGHFGPQHIVPAGPHYPVQVGQETELENGVISIRF